MTSPEKPGEPEDNAPKTPRATSAGDGSDLGRRSRALEEALAAKRLAAPEGDGRGGSSKNDAGSFGQALKLSSEFIAGVAVGAGLGWLIDNVAGTSPWGLIIFLLLGFAAGVLNVLRSAGLVAEPHMRVKPPEPGGRDEN